MPSRAWKVCSAPGCAVLIRSGGRCMLHEERHLKEKNERYDAQRPKAAARGYDARHRKWREFILKRDPVCKMCGHAKSTVADHIVPLRKSNDWSASNGQGLCGLCHNRKRGVESHE